MSKLSKVKMVGVLFFSMVLLSPSQSFAESKLSKGIVKYQPRKNTKSIDGELNCKGSTNVGALLKIWLPAFKKIYPSVKTSMNFKGSSDGIRGLIDGTATIGATSRPITPKEIVTFKKAKGYAPTEIKVALDALAVYVNSLNKLESITLEELDAIFSIQRKRGYIKSIDKWNDIKNNHVNSGKINLYLFDKNSGTRSFFRYHVMLKGNYNQTKITSDEYIDIEHLLTAIANDKNGIGFGSLGSNNFKVKALALSKRENYPTYYPCDKNIKNGTYPLTRFFYIYLDVPPTQAIPTMLYEFCKFILSYEGQKTIIRAGGLSLSPQQIGTELSKMRRK